MSRNFQPERVHEQQFSVAFDYPVVACREPLAATDEHLVWTVTRKEPEREHPTVFVADAGVIEAWPGLDRRVETYARAHDQRLKLQSPLLRVPGGEAGKNDPDVVKHLLHAFADARLDRQACVVAIGGGAALDVVGYAASLVHRGLRVVRLPTTVLAQNDAGVGVKTGVNAFGAKNFLGTFAPPFAVVNASCWLETLSPRDRRAGMAEAVKVALIRDGAFFDWIEGHAEALGNAPTREAPNSALEELIHRCATLHLDHIARAGDPFETGSARPLDYGHWAAHRLEVQTDHELRHGEAVAIGMLLDARYAEQAGLLPTRDLTRLLQLTRNLGLPTFHDALLQQSGGRLRVLVGLDQFREHLGGDLSITLLTGIGHSIEVRETDEARIVEAVRWLEASAASSH